jgi:phage terminase large subunit
MLKALEKPGNYYIIAPTYTQAKQIYWNDLLKVNIPGAIIKETNESELFIEFQQVHYKMDTKEILGYDIDSDHSQSELPSRIYLKGANNPDSLRGVSLSGAVLDEFAFFQYANETWRKIVRPALADQQGWAIFSSTPDGVHNTFFDIVELAKRALSESKDPANDKRWFYSHATMLDNTSIEHRVQEWNETKEEYTREGKIDEWVQEWEAKFTTPSSLVYPEFDDTIHVINPNLIPRENLTYAIGMDFGLKDPFAAVFVAIDKDDNWYIYDEIYLPDLPVDKIARVLHQKMGDQYFSKIVGDSAGATEIASLKSKELGDMRVWVTPAKKGKDSLRGGIRQVRTKLYVREGSGKPKLFVGRNCTATIKEFQSYKHIRDSFGEVSDTPEDKNNHLMDAIRYLIMESVSGSKPIPKAKKTYTASGRLVS